MLPLVQYVNVRDYKEKTAFSRGRDFALIGDALPLDLLESENVLAHLASVFFPHSFPDDEQNADATVETGKEAPSVTDVYRILVEQIPAVIFITFFDKGYGDAYVSPQIETTLGFTPDEWLNNPALWYQQTHPEDRERLIEEASRLLLTGEALRTEFRAISRQGQIVWFHCEAKLVQHADGRPLFIHGIGFDITKWQRDEKALREYAERMKVLSRRLIDVQEAERRTIALELHDEIGQILTGLKLTLEVCARLPEGEMRAGLAGAQTLVNDLMARTRRLSLNLRPATLDHLGLLSALLRHFRHYTSQTQVGVDFRHTGIEEKRFAPDLETAAFRIIQEALTNIARHSGAEEAIVRIRADRQMLCIQIEDDGKGFDAETALAAGQSNGLTGMRERALMLGGSFNVESRPGKTRLTVEWHLS